MRNKADLSALRELVASRGWQILIEVHAADVQAAAFALADNPHMPESEMRFRIGAIHAARGIIHCPDRLIQQLESELALESAQTLTGERFDQPIQGDEP
ncbi:hypothetical protein UFOVP708_3 [uncultured Caudovirales phage]|uniref:Uncharacterized protein n=1 Tax=uncultured Caudovirales phage TaxID=2100421 RepID=A0A6J5NTA7_9CAUD|nr:hypothetical protein UFOVP708_3 [uncultured Caudovirales phage]